MFLQPPYCRKRKILKNVYFSKKCRFDENGLGWCTVPNITDETQAVNKYIHSLNGGKNNEEY